MPARSTVAVEKISERDLGTNLLVLPTAGLLIGPEERLVIKPGLVSYLPVRASSNIKTKVVYHLSPNSRPTGNFSK